MENAPSNIHTPRLYDLCDTLTEYLVYAMVVFSPWAFGTTEDWSIWTMNIAGYCLGLLLLSKWIIRWKTSYQPYRWQDNSKQNPNRQRLIKFLTRSLAGLTILLLAYILCQVVNARADYLWGEGRFEYFDNYIKWLPYSYDQSSTLSAFWRYLALAIGFWAIRDWLATKSRKERRGADAVSEKKSRPEHSSISSHTPRSALRTPHSEFGLLPRRLNRLLWVMCINGGLLALEGILQRLSGTNKLLWLITPYWTMDPLQQFGPWPYRGNAAVWFNLSWSVCVGFLFYKYWETLTSADIKRRITGGPYVLLIPCALLMVVAPLVAASRLGIAITLASLIFLVFFFFLFLKKKSLLKRVLFASTVGGMLCLVAFISWNSLKERLINITDISFFEVSEIETFRIDLKLSIPQNPSFRWQQLISLTDSPEKPNYPHSFWVGLNQEGGLFVRLVGETTQDFVQRAFYNFESIYSGREVTLTFIKSGDLTILVDNQEIKTQEAKSGDAPEWSATVNSSYLFRGHGYTHSVNGGVTKEISVYRENTLGEITEPLGNYNLAERSIKTLLNNTGRSAIYESAKQMAEDFPMLGIGVDAFPALNLLYKPSYTEKNAAKIHDDWLEMRVSTGAIGYGLIVLFMIHLGILGLVSKYTGSVPGNILLTTTATALVGCLIHAKFDFPLQIVSIGFLFVVICSTLGITWENRPQ